MTAKILRALALLLWVLWDSSLAYVVPPAYILKTWTDKLAETKTIRVRQVTTFWDGTNPQGTPVAEEIWIKRTGFFRKGASTVVGQTDYIFTPDRAGRVTAGKYETLSPFEVIGPAGIFYLFSERSRMVSVFRQVGVDVSRSQLALSGRQVLLEIGDPKGTRIQFGKDDEAPAGLEFMGKTHKFDYAKSSKFPIRYPSTIEITASGKLLERTEVTSVETNIAIPDSLFDKSLFPVSGGKR
jgi:hypothetical protein